MKDLLEPYRKRRKISNILEENSKLNTENVTKSDEPRITRNVLGGLFSGLVTTPLGVAGIVEAIPRSLYGLGKAAIDENYDTKDALVDTIINNKSFQAAGYVDDKIRDVMGLKKFEDLSGSEQLASLSGEMLPIIATGGTAGLVKLSNKAAQKAAVNLAKKKALKTGQTLSRSGIIKAKNTADTAVNMLLPGIQVTKNAPIKQKMLEIGLQGGIPLGINEGSRYFAEQEGIFGDYTPKEDKNISLISDKRKIKGKTYVDEVNPGVISDYKLDIKAQEEKEKADMYKTVGLTAGALLGSVAGIRKLRKLYGKEIDSIDITQTPKTQDTIDNLDARTKADMTLADRFAFKKSYVDQGLLKEETANRLAQDTRSKINKAFETGDLYDGIELSFSPQSTYNKLNTLRLQNPLEYKNIEDFLEISSKIQDETYRFNKFIMKGETDYSPDDYIKGRANGKINSNLSSNYTSTEDLVKNTTIRNELLLKINKNPITKQIFDEISQIGDALLKKMEKSGMWSQDEINVLRKNRTLGGIFTYKPRINKTNPTIKERLWNYLFEKTPFDKLKGVGHIVRGEDKIDNAYNYFDVFEYNFKQTLQDIEDNTIKRQAIKEMETGSFAKINKKLNEYEADYNRLSNIDNINKNNKESLKKLDKKVEYDINKLFSVRPIGSIRLDDGKIAAKKNFFDLLNRPVDRKTTMMRTLEENLSQSPQRFDNLRNSKDVISFIDNGREYFYKVDKYIKSAFDVDTTLPSMIAYHMKSLKNLVQTTITGKLNPAFAIPSSMMATHEALTLLPKLAKELELAPDLVSRTGYLREFWNTSKEIYTNNVLNQTLKQYDRLLVKSLNGDDKILNKLAKINVEEIRAKLKSQLLTQIQQQGGASSRPLNTNVSNFYELKPTTKISDNIEKFLLKHDGINGAAQKINLINFLQNSIRETPSVALTKYLAKQSGAIVDNNIKDPKKLQKIIDVVGTYTANVGRSGSHFGTLGAITRGIENYVPYGNVMIKSLAPKVRSSGIVTGVENVAKTFQDLYDPNIRYIDILHNMQKYSTDLLKNKFFEGLVVTSLMPSTIQYVWNHGSKENIEAYYQLSDYEKASKFILVNFFGKGRHLSLAKDQEVALADNIYTTLLDGTIGMSKYNEVDPAFKQSKLIMQSLSRSVGIDSIPLLDIIANSQGYDVNLNVFTDKPTISGLSRNKINQDLSQTAYENGLVNQETTALINSLFGITGSTLLGSFEEANVGSNTNTSIQDFSQRLFEGFTKSAKIIGTKNISSYNETSKAVYNKQNLINKIASVSVKTPAQEKAYETVKMYNRNRIKPIHDAITDLRKSISTVRANGCMPDGSVLDYEGRKAKINEINKQLQQLFAQEYNEFKNLDNLLEQLYGNGINLNNFMEKLQ